MPESRSCKNYYYMQQFTHSKLSQSGASLAQLGMKITGKERGKMAMRVIDIHVSSFTGKKTGEVATLACLFIVRPADESEEGVKGEIAEAIKVKPGVVARAPVGSEIQPYYDRYGNIHVFDVVSPAK